MRDVIAFAGLPLHSGARIIGRIVNFLNAAHYMGLYLTATRGMGAPETRICYERAEPLCHSVNRPRLLFMELLGQLRYTLHTDKISAAMQIAERVHALAREENDAGLMLAGASLGNESRPP
jgi:hypothetical protein